MAYFKLWKESSDAYKREFYYTHLKSNEQCLYEMILTAILGLHEAVKINTQTSEERLSYIYLCVLWDNPHICYVSCNDVMVKRGLTAKELCFKYLFPVKACRKIQEDFQNRLEQIMEEIDLEGLEELEKELFIHDYMAANLEYDFASLQRAGTKEWDFAHSVYGAVVNKRAVCQGISAMFKVLGDMAEISSILISGTISGNEEGAAVAAPGPHAWNLVCIDGIYVHLDVTNDLNLVNGKRIYSKFNFDDKHAHRNYLWKDRAYPKCESMQYFYYEYYHLTVHSEKELQTYIRRRKEKRSFDICFGEEFSLPSENPHNYAGQLVLQELTKYFGNVRLEFQWISEVRILCVCRT